MRTHWLSAAIVLAILAAVAPLSGQQPGSATNHVPGVVGVETSPPPAAGNLQGRAALLQGTVIPVLLETTLDSRRDKPGKRVMATVGQDILLANEGVIRVRSKLLGQVMRVDND